MNEKVMKRGRGEEGQNKYGLGDLQLVVDIAAERVHLPVHLHDLVSLDDMPSPLRGGEGVKEVGLSRNGDVLQGGYLAAAPAPLPHLELNVKDFAVHAPGCLAKDIESSQNLVQRVVL